MPASPPTRSGLSLALAVAALTLAVGPASAQAPAPRIVAPQPVFDAGVVGRGAKISHEFVLHNQGGEVIHLREVKPSCGCTVASFDSQVAPGQEGRVRAEVDTGSFRGPISKDLTVYTSDSSNPAIRLTVRADVQPAVDASPGYFRFIHTQGEAAPKVTQAVWSPDRADLEVLGVESPLAHVTVAFHPAAEGEKSPDGKGRQWAVVATLASEAPEGPLSGDIAIATNHPGQPTLLLPIAGYVRQQLAVLPPRADLGRFAAGQPRQASVEVKNHGEQPVQLLSVATDVPGLVARLDEREKGKRFDVLLELGPNAPKGPLKGMLRIKTTSARQPLLEVPVQGEVQ